MHLRWREGGSSELIDVVTRALYISIYSVEIM